MMKWNANLYEDKHNFIAEYGKGLLDYLEDGGGKTVLDLGCGTGSLTAELAKRAERVMGADSSPDMVEMAREMYPQIPFFVQDACRLEWKCQFDVVFSNAVFHWIQDQRALLSSVKGALKPGGKLICEFGAEGNIESIEKAFKAAMEKQERSYRSAFFFPSTENYRSLLTQAGYEVELLFDFDRPTLLKDGKAGLRNWMLQFYAKDLKDLSPKQQEDVLLSVEGQLKERFFKEGHWTADYRRLRAVAVKPG